MKDFHRKQKKDIKISITNAEFNCRVLGNGEKNVIAFHGFGQDGNSFLPVAIKIPEYTIYSFDLPFHGETKFQDPSHFLTNQEVVELIKKLTDLIAIERFSLIGFSIGAKLLFPVLEKFYSRVENVWLLAPDGIKINLWYRVATGTRLMRYLFRSILNNPQMVKRFGNWIQFINLLDKKTLFFALKSIDTKNKRDQVYYIWTCLRKLHLNPGRTSELVNKSNISVLFILGEKDLLIPESKIIPLSGNLKNSKIVTLTCGHQKLIEYFADWSSSV